MFLIVAMALSLLIGLARGGRLVNLAAIDLRYAWVPLSLFLLQVVLVQYPIVQAEGPWFSVALYLAASYGALIAFLLVNRALPGAKLTLVGAVLNMAVILANGGHMPVTLHGLVQTGHEDRIVFRQGTAYVMGSKDIVLELDETQLWPLSDIFRIPKPFPFSTNFSLGDIAIGLGVAILTHEAILGKANMSSRERVLRADRAELHKETRAEKVSV